MNVRAAVLRDNDVTPRGRVTGAGDSAFDGSQNQSGRYSYQFSLYDSHGTLLELPFNLSSSVPAW